MANTTDDQLRVEIVNIVDHVPWSLDDDNDGLGASTMRDEETFRGIGLSHDRVTKPRFGIRATFAPGYSSNLDIRMKLLADGRICGERLIENSQIHSIQGHTLWIRSNIHDTRKSSRSSWVDIGQSMSLAHLVLH